MSFILLCRCFVIIVQNSVLNFCSNAFRGRSHWSLIIFVVDVIQSYIAIKNLKRGKTDLLFATSYERHPQYLIMVGFQEKNWFKLSLFLDFVSKWKKCLPEVEFFPWVIGLSFVLESQFFRRPVLKKERGLTAYSSKIRPPCVTSFRRWNFPLKSKKGRKEGRKGESLTLLQIWHLLFGYLFNLIQVDYQTALHGSVSQPFNPSIPRFWI